MKNSGRSCDATSARRSRALVAIAALGLIWLAAPGDAQAYLDPVTGNGIIQIILATLLGGLFALKMYWRRLKAFFTGRPLEDDAERPRDSTPTDPKS
jgi:hypothetical protein